MVDQGPISHRPVRFLEKESFSTSHDVCSAKTGVKQDYCGKPTRFCQGKRDSISWIGHGGPQGPWLHSGDCTLDWYPSLDNCTKCIAIRFVLLCMVCGLFSQYTFSYSPLLPTHPVVSAPAFIPVSCRALKCNVSSRRRKCPATTTSSPTRCC